MMNKACGPILGLFFIALVIGVLCYVSSPQYIVSSYWKYLSTGQYEKAKELTLGQVFDLEISDYSSIEQVFFGRVNLQHEQVKIDGNKAIVSGVMSLPDIAEALNSDQELVIALQRVPLVQKKYAFELQRTNEGWKINSLTFGGD